MYFAKFPKFIANVGGEQKVITDFFTRVSVGDQFRNYAALLLPHSIRDGQRPESLAYEVYGAATYHWVILLVNNIVDPREEWPLSNEDLWKKVQVSYSDPYGIHHYEHVLTKSEIVSGAVSVFDATDVAIVTNLDYETRLNDAKRQIVLLDPKYLGQFVQSFETAIRP